MWENRKRWNEPFIFLTIITSLVQRRSNLRSETSQDLRKKLKDKSNIFDKIDLRKDFLKKCGEARNIAHQNFLHASFEYDNSKASFYTALELAQFDQRLTEMRKLTNNIYIPTAPNQNNILEATRYKAFVKEMDRQSLENLKSDAFVQVEVAVGKNIEPAFVNRMQKIQLLGNDRNRSSFKFDNIQRNYEQAKEAVFKEIMLGLKDNLIGNIGKRFLCFF